MSVYTIPVYFPGMLLLREEDDDDDDDQHHGSLVCVNYWHVLPGRAFPFFKLICFCKHPQWPPFGNADVAFVRLLIGFHCNRGLKNSIHITLLFLWLQCNVFSRTMIDTAGGWV